MPPDLADPWRAFLEALDVLVSHPVDMHCRGGFVVTTQYGMPRTTADLDVLSILLVTTNATSRRRQDAAPAFIRLMASISMSSRWRHIQTATRNASPRCIQGYSAISDCWHSIRMTWSSQS